MKANLRNGAAIFAALVLTGTGASATTVSWTAYTDAQKQEARDFRAASVDTDNTVAIEDFENDVFVPVPNSGGPGSATPLNNTAVGDFTTTEGATCGGSCDTPDDQSLIRNTSGFGRYNMTLGGSKWLDSNDNAAINLNVSGLGMFDSLSLFLTDIDDVGPKTFSIFVDGEEFDISSQYSSAKLPGNQNDPDNADLFLISIGFDSLVDSAFISFAIDDGDGFGMDDVRVGSSVSPVPVPATLPLLMAGVGVMGWVSRRRKQEK